MQYSEQKIKSINDYYMKTTLDFNKTILKLSNQVYTNERANEFFHQGFMRRYHLIYHCVHKIFSIYPPSRVIILSEDECNDITSFLHVIFINMYGATDNLAWIVNYEKELGLEEKQRKLISLFSKEISRFFNSDFNKYLCNNKEGGFKYWYDKYCIDFRHSLSHRIPLYVPPFGVDKEKGCLKHIMPLFVHSYFENSSFVFLLEQILCDFSLLTELINKFVDGFQ